MASQSSSSTLTIDFGGDDLVIHCRVAKKDLIGKSRIKISFDLPTTTVAESEDSSEGSWDHVESVDEPAPTLGTFKTTVQPILETIQPGAHLEVDAVVSGVGSWEGTSMQTVEHHFRAPTIGLEERNSNYTPLADDMRSEPCITLNQDSVPSARHFETFQRQPLALQNAMTGHAPGNVVELDRVASVNALAHYQPQGNLNFFDIPLEVRRMIYRFVAEEFEPPQESCLCHEGDHLGAFACDHEVMDAEAIWRRAWRRRNTGILGINKQIRSEVQALEIVFAPACFFFEGRYCDYVCLMALQERLDNRRQRLVRKIVLRLRVEDLPERKNETAAMYLKGWLSWLSGIVEESFRCAVGEKWLLEADDQGEAGWRMIYTR